MPEPALSLRQATIPYTIAQRHSGTKIVSALIVSAIFGFCGRALSQPDSTRVVESSAVPNSRATDEIRKMQPAGEIAPLRVLIVQPAHDEARARKREEESDKRQDADLVAQQVAASAAETQAIVGRDSYQLARTAIWLSFVGTLLLAITLWYTRKSVAVTRDSAERQLRAYINVLSASAEWEMGRPIPENSIRVKVRTRNNGKTPATEVKCWATAVSRPPDWNEFPEANETPDDAVDVSGPGQLHCFLLSCQGPVDEPDDEVDVWRRGDRVIFAYGKISYIDAFKVSRTTKFRLLMPKDGIGDTGGVLRACRDGNEVT